MPSLRINLRSGLFLFSIAGLAGAIAYATSAPVHKAPTLDRTDKTDKTTSKVHKIKFKHDGEIDAYLTSIRSYMLVPPRDGLFGASRIPTLHGQGRNKIPGYQDVAKFGEENLQFASFVVGLQPAENLKYYQEAVSAGRMKESDVPKFRQTAVHWVTPNGKAKDVVAQQIESTPTLLVVNRKELYAEVSKFQEKCMTEGYDDFSDSIKIAGRSGYIVMKAVKASDKSCYSCHTNIKEGEAIGFVSAVLIKNDP